jgi:hypothetical protein
MTIEEVKNLPQKEKDRYKDYAEAQGVSVESYIYLFMNHDHDHNEVLFKGAAAVTMTDALEAIRIDREDRNIGRDE